MQPISIQHKGKKYKRYPKSKHRCHKLYYRSGKLSLHREIWKDDHGEIPKNCVIHHKDHNPFNNAISNLTCVSKREHNIYHFNERYKDPSKKRKILKWFSIAQKKSLASGYHSSDRARKIASKNGKKNHIHLHSESNIKEFTCKTCGKLYKTFNIGFNRRCSQKCRRTYQNQQALVKKVCILCGASFKDNKYWGSKTCSEVCRRRQQGITKRQKTSL